ncbi:hypothetical protein [Lederbergia citri]|uniref:Uncharacterized protein n=1 Tax=Lederbergia citri TaxID=2833580 RepID=A0A942YJ73_9BACI|nr:hypothetical protein [Lederbergia citri]MBS4197225.1 hypothetical protein [Lederbergia citri]
MNLKNSLKTIGITVLLFSIVGIQSISAEAKDINIETTANGILFNTENLKPGDWIPRDITIMNNGRKDFKYTAKIGKTKSTKGLFEELDLVVKNEKETLFEGKLKDFKGFTSRELTKGSSEILFFEVKCLLI